MKWSLFMRKNLILLAIVMLLLNGCESALDQRINETIQMKEQIEKNKKDKVDPIKGTITLQQLEKEFTPSEIQNDEGMFVDFISLTLFHLYNRDLDASEFVDVLKKYRYEKMNSGEEEYLLQLYTLLQKKLIEQKYKGLEYKNLLFDYENEEKTTAHFYRVIKLREQTFHYYETFIQKDGEKWYLLKDQPVDNPEKIKMLYVESLTSFTTSEQEVDS